MSKPDNFGFYVSIPTALLLDESVNAKARLLYGVISNLANTKGYCYASNLYLSDLTGWHRDTISDFVKQLVEKNYLKRVDKPSNIGMERQLFLGDTSKVKLPERVRRTDLDPPGETTLHNNITIITKENKESSSEKELVLNMPLFESVTEEKERPQKEAKKKPPVDPSYPDFVKMWTEAYPELGFEAKDGLKIKSLIAKTKKYIQDGGKDPTDDAAKAMFAYVLAYLKRSNNWYHGKDAAIIDSKYLSIIFEIKNGKSTGKKQSARDYINSFK